MISSHCVPPWKCLPAQEIPQHARSISRFPSIAMASISRGRAGGVCIPTNRGYEKKGIISLTKYAYNDANELLRMMDDDILPVFRASRRLCVNGFPEEDQRKSAESQRNRKGTQFLSGAVPPCEKAFSHSAAEAQRMPQRW